MSNRLLISNLPPEVNENEIEALLADAGAEGIEVSINREGDATKGTAVLILPGVDRATLDRLANEINGMPFRGRTLSAYVPLFT